MAYGLVTIGVEGQGPSAYIENNQTGLLIKPQDLDDLVNTLTWIFQQPLLAQNIAKRGKNCVLQNWTWKNHAEELIQIYQEILPNG